MSLRIGLCFLLLSSIHSLQHQKIDSVVQNINQVQKQNQVLQPISIKTKEEENTRKSFDIDNKKVGQKEVDDRWDSEWQSMLRGDQYAASILSGPRWGGSFIGPITRYLNLCIVGILFSFLLSVRNNATIYHSDILLNNLQSRSIDQGVLTVSNHQSMLDDPGLWALILPWWTVHPDKLRWSLCTDDVFFANPYLSAILGAGNVMPLYRNGLLDQPLFKRFHEKLDQGSWCHIFPEGRIYQNWRFPDLTKDRKLGPLKVGVGKLIAHCRICPIVIPMYHKGMDIIYPEIVLDDPYTRQASKPSAVIPKSGNSVEVYFGNPVDFRPMISAFRDKYPGALDHWRSTEETLLLYADITQKIKIELLKLEAIAYEEKKNTNL